MSEEEFKLQIAVMSGDKFDFLKILRFVHVDHGLNQVRKYFHFKLHGWNRRGIHRKVCLLAMMSSDKIEVRKLSYDVFPPLCLTYEVEDSSFCIDFVGI